MSIYELFDGEIVNQSELYWMFINSVELSKEFKLWKSAIVKKGVEGK